MIRKITTVLTFYFLAFVAYGAPIALPQGDYQTVCRDCYINDNNQLICQCPMPRQNNAEDTESTSTTEWILRSVDLDGCEANRVSLINGYLFCDNSNEDDIESVKGTEQNPVLDENDNPVEEPSPDTPVTGVQLDQNMDPVEPEPEKNNLPTEEKPTPSAPPAFDYSDVNEADLVPLPPGDYIKYCPSCKVSNGVLTCECYPKTSFFSLTTASIPLKSCGKGKITYRGGTLLCKRDLLGTLSPTCRDCEVKDNELTCTCLKTPCQWSREDLSKGRRNYRSTLEEFRYCTRRIVNCNGQLRCGGCNLFDYYEEFLRPYEGEREGKFCYHMPPKLRFIEDWWWNE